MLWENKMENKLKEYNGEYLCGRYLDGIGWRRLVIFYNKDVCCKPATKIKESTCGCGECDMTIHACEDHYKEY